MFKPKQKIKEGSSKDDPFFLPKDSMDIKCHFCSQKIPLEIYIEEGEKQEFIIDCEVCSHKLLIKAEWDDEEEEFDVEVDAAV